MLRVLIELLPLFIPLALFLLWHAKAVHGAKKRGQEAPRLKEGPWGWTLVATIALGLGMMAFYGLTVDSRKGEYAPPHMEDGRVVPGKVTP